MAAAGLWTASLFSPALRVNGTVSSGVDLFVTGPLGLLAGIPDWLGNPALLVGELVIWFRGPRGWRFATAAAILLLAVVAATRHMLPMDEGGTPYPVEARLIGFHLWIGSLFLLAAVLSWPVRGTRDEISDAD